jgi:hypothetical protein
MMLFVANIGPPNKANLQRGGKFARVEAAAGGCLCVSPVDRRIWKVKFQHHWKKVSQRKLRSFVLWKSTFSCFCMEPIFVFVDYVVIMHIAEGLYSVLVSIGSRFSGGHNMPSTRDESVDELFFIHILFLILNFVNNLNKQ